MPPKQPTEQELLKNVLEPLLDDFQYWFGRSQTLLKSEQLPFFSAQEQEELLKQIEQNLQEVKTAKMLFKATDGNAGIEPQMLLPWHRLVAKCWSMAQKWREVKNHDL